MEEFYLFDEKRANIPLEMGFPEDYQSKFGFPGSIKCHAFVGKYPLLFQSIKVGKHEIAISDYLTRESGKITCHANTNCLELHFLLTGKLYIKLRGLEWTDLEPSTHNMIALTTVKNEVYFKSTPVSTFDIHFNPTEITNLVKRYPKLAPLLDALIKKENCSLFKIMKKTNIIILDLIFKIIAALKAGLEKEASTIKMLDHLIILALEDKPLKSKYQYTYDDIEKLYQAHRLITQYLDEKDILVNKIKDSRLKPDKFREGFKLLFRKLPNQYLQEERLAKAQKLATEGRASNLEDIAQLCGYTSSAPLSRAYFKLYGVKISNTLLKNRKNSK